MSLIKQIDLHENYNDGDWHRIAIITEDQQTMVRFDDQSFIYDVIDIAPETGSAQNDLFLARAERYVSYHVISKDWSLNLTIGQFCAATNECG